MKRLFLDTSSLLDFLIASNKARADEVERWLELAEKRELNLWSTTLVMVETVDVLELGFGVSRSAIKEIMLGVLHCDGLELDHKDVLVQAVYSFTERGEGFGTCYHLALVGD